MKNIRQHIESQESFHSIFFILDLQFQDSFACAEIFNVIQPSHTSQYLHFCLGSLAFLFLKIYERIFKVFAFTITLDHDNFHFLTNLLRKAFFHAVSHSAFSLQQFLFFYLPSINFHKSFELKHFLKSFIFSLNPLSLNQTVVNLFYLFDEFERTLEFVIQASQEQENQNTIFCNFIYQIFEQEFLLFSQSNFSNLQEILYGLILNSLLVQEKGRYLFTSEHEHTPSPTQIYQLRVQFLDQSIFSPFLPFQQIQIYEDNKLLIEKSCMLLQFNVNSISTMRNKLNLSESLSRTDEDEGQPKKRVKMDNINFLTGEEYSDRYYQILQTRKKLPAYESKHKLLTLLNDYQVVVLVGETGSGKTTQIPQFLVQAGYCKNKSIACTQPRRVAAMSVAKRVSEEMDVELGQQVGYSIRFQDLTSKNTIVKYMTDGMLLRQAMVDRELQRYSVIILDEAHERTLNTDILFGLVKEILRKRTDLKLIVMSATLDAVKFQQYFDGAPRLNIPGRMFPVDVYFSKEPESDYVQASIRTAVTIHESEPEGDVLIFLTGQEEIQTACSRIDEQIKKLGDKVGPTSIIPLYSTLPPHQQQRIFDDPPKPRKGLKGRKIIVATNIAETSITIDGIVYVVDPGFSKQKVFNPRMRVESLLVSPISKASAKQRAGRAGRTRPGKCFRLYTQASYNQELIQNTYPEAQRSNLNSTVLTLIKLGIDDLVHFDFMDPPAPETLMRALELLNYLGALDDEGKMTSEGEKMAEFPLDPQLSKVLLTSTKYNCVEEMLTLVSCMSSPNIFLRPKEKMAEATDAHAKFTHPEGDHLTIITTFHEYLRKNMDVDWCFKNFLNHRHLKSAVDVRDQLRLLLEKADIKVKEDLPLQLNPVNIKKCLLNGYFTQIAILQKNNVYLTVKDSQVVVIHPSSVLTYRPQFALYHELVLTKKNYMRTVIDIKPSWFYEIAPEYFRPESIKNIETRKTLAKIEKQYIEALKKKQKTK